MFPIILKKQKLLQLKKQKLLQKRKKQRHTHPLQRLKGDVQK